MEQWNHAAHVSYPLGVLVLNSKWFHGVSLRFAFKTSWNCLGIVHPPSKKLDSTDSTNSCCRSFNIFWSCDGGSDERHRESDPCRFWILLNNDRLFANLILQAHKWLGHGECRLHVNIKLLTSLTVAAVASPQAWIAGRRKVHSPSWLLSKMETN